jgi:hypothetical protein
MQAWSPDRRTGKREPPVATKCFDRDDGQCGRSQLAKQVRLHAISLPKLAWII